MSLINQDIGYLWVKFDLLNINSNMNHPKKIARYNLFILLWSLPHYLFIGIWDSQKLQMYWFYCNIINGKLENEHDSPVKPICPPPPNLNLYLPRLPTRAQDYRKYTIPTGVRGKVFPTDLCRKSFPTGGLGNVVSHGWPWENWNFIGCGHQQLFNLFLCPQNQQHQPLSTFLTVWPSENLPGFPLWALNANKSSL